MKENQHLEWKQTWRDEYLKWVCGFANAEGGMLVVGRDDNGSAIGVKGARKLLVDIPNKVRDILGIMVDVDLRQEDGVELVEIRVDPYPSPVNYKGEYCRRTGPWRSSSALMPRSPSTRTSPTSSFAPA